MKRALGVAASLLVFFFSSSPSFAAPRTMRVDYFHTGSSHEEWFSMDRVVLEPLEWPGNLNKSIDGSQLGNYLFEVRERGSGKLLYSRGFDSVFGEWKTTEEALHANRTFSESLRFPSPDAPVEVSLKERAESGFHEVWKTVVDPKDKFVDRSRLPSPGPLLELQKMGDPATKVDLLVLGTATPQPNVRSLRKTRGDSWRRCFRHRRFASTRKTSTCGVCVRRRRSRACRGLRAEFTGGRRWARRTTRSVSSAMC